MPINTGVGGSIIAYACTKKNVLGLKVLSWKTSISMKGYKQGLGQCVWRFGYMCT